VFPELGPRHKYKEKTDFEAEKNERNCKKTIHLYLVNSGTVSNFGTEGKLNPEFVLCPEIAHCPRINMFLIGPWL